MSNLNQSNERSQFQQTNTDASAIILGTGRGIRRLDAMESTPTPLLKTDQGEAILDKQIKSLQRTGHLKISCIAGYHIEKLIAKHSEIDYYYDASWRENGGISGLAHHSELIEGSLLLVEGATLFEPEAVEQLQGTEGEISVGIKSFPSADAAREANRTLDGGLVVLNDGDIEPVSNDETVPDALLTGPVYLSKQGAEVLKAEVNSLVGEDDKAISSLIDLLSLISSSAATICTVEVGETVRHYDEDNALAKFLLGTKADTLERLEQHIGSAQFPEQIAVDVNSFERSPDEITNRIQSTFDNGPIVIRSSADTEDGWLDSQAGAFHTELAIDPTDKQRLTGAIERVIQSLRENPQFAEEYDQILIQKQVVNVKMSGVAFTRDLDSGGPYTVISYDDTTGRTDTVTAGHGTPQRTAYFHHSLDGLETVENESLTAVKRTIDEIRTFLEDPPLDIEFAVDDKGRVIILQVRPLAVHTDEHRYDERDIANEIEAVMNQIDGLQANRPFLLGDETVLGVMPDWNPAEMIGTEPDPISVSLYEFLITDNVWARARAASGYRDVRPTPLMVTLAGRPYIDSLADFNSFLPASLPEDLGHRLVEHYVERLSENPELQDKVEFDIAFSCLDFGFESRKGQLEAAGFDEGDLETLRTHLRSLTDSIVQGDVATIDEQRNRLLQLGRRRCQILGSPCSGWSQSVHRVKLLLEDTREFGTLPFAILARYAFIATAFLQSLVDRGVLSKEEHEIVLEGIPTVAGEMAADVQRLREGSIRPEKFFERYGHLRPGTYDIHSPRYDERPQQYFDIDESIDLNPLTLDRQRNSVIKDWTPSVGDEANDILGRKRAETAELINQEGFEFSVSELYNFITEAIPLRELAKFEFTRNLSAAITLLRNSAETDLGISPEHIASIPINRLLEPSTKNPSPVLDREFERTINYREKRASVQQRVELPPLIRDSKDVLSFEVSSERPNFITSEKTTAPVVQVEDRENLDSRYLDGHIVLITAADPGYDWIFGYNIAGLVTKYGGVASHMAIRAAEFGLPAGIGCGDVVFDEIAQADRVELDCASGTLQEVN